MTHLLEQVGRALYGDRWQAPLARALGSSSDRALRRWLAGEQPVPVGVWRDLARLCDARSTELDVLVLDLDAAATDADA